MLSRSTMVVVFALFVSTFELGAQGPPPAATPQREHEWLRQFTGEWDTESESVTGPGQPPFPSATRRLRRADARTGSAPTRSRTRQRRAFRHLHL